MTKIALSFGEKTKIALSFGENTKILSRKKPSYTVKEYFCLTDSFIRSSGLVLFLGNYSKVERYMEN